MRILFLAPRMPLPADTGGKIRTLNLIKQAAKIGRVDLLCFSFEKNDANYINELKNINVHTHLVLKGEDTIITKTAAILFNQLPYSVGKYFTPQMKSLVEKYISENHYEVVHIDHIHMAHYQAYIQRASSLLDEHNVEYRILERCRDVERSPVKRMLFSSQASKMKHFESDMIKNFSACCGVSEDDCTILKKLTEMESKIHVVPNGVDTGYFAPAKSPNLEDALVFTGSMDWFPNDDSVIYFCEDILPIIWKTKPEVKFYIVGKGPSKKVKEIASKDKRIVLTGRVDDVREYVWRSKVFVVPLRIGGGTRLKILEAMSMEKAVVSTTIGAEGIACTDNKDIVIADAPKTFAQSIIDMLNHSKRRNDIGMMGRKLVENLYDWDVVGKKLKEIYESLGHGH